MASRIFFVSRLTQRCDIPLNDVRLSACDNTIPKIMFRNDTNNTERNITKANVEKHGGKCYLTTVVQSENAYSH